MRVAILKLEHKMITLRIGILVAYTAVLIGCTTNADKTTICCANYERPSFEINFIPDLTDRKETFVDISEDSSRVAICLNWAGERHKLADTSSYLKFKKRILISSQWQKRVPETQLPSFFTGPSTPILIVRSGDMGICLQGTDIPQGWREELIRLTTRGRGKKISKQHCGCNGAQRR